MILLWLIVLVLLAGSAWSFSIFYYESARDGHIAALKDKLGPSFWPVLFWCVLRGASSFGLATLLYPATLIGYFRRAGTEKTDGIPVVFIHGYLHNRTGWLFFRWLFHRWKHEPTFAFTFRGRVDEQATALADIVERVLETTASEKLDLVGHSMGGLVIRRYLAREGGEKVRRAVTLGSPHGGSRLAAFALTRAGRELLPESGLIRGLKDTPLPEGVELFSLYTSFDEMVLPVKSSVLEGEGMHTEEVAPMSHVSLIFSVAVARRVRKKLM